tara:strand:+ start:3311 stop:3733 length:423 start_codon:yes stop_codon:yes gene_type:complete
MARITVEDCIDKFDSRFELVLVAANRARKLHSGEIPTVEKDNDKNTVIALREIADETISADEFKDNLVEEYQSVSPIDEEELALEFNEGNNEELTIKDDELNVSAEIGEADEIEVIETTTNNNDDKTSNSISESQTDQTS